MRFMVCIIDDEATFRCQFKRAMKSAGFRLDELDLVEFDNPSDALKELLGQRMPRLVLFDQNLKADHLNGTGAIRKLREMGDMTSVVGIISSSNKPEEIAEAKRAGGRFWIRKGGGREAMIEKMARFKAEFFDNLVEPQKMALWIELGLE